MADFAAVIKKTLDKMGETTPEMREKVYAKARETVTRQIDAMASRPPQAAIDRQFSKLDEAIESIEANYASVSLDDVFADIELAVEPEPEAVEEAMDEAVPEVPEQEPEPKPAVEEYFNDEAADIEPEAGAIAEAEEEADPVLDALDEMAGTSDGDSPVAEAAENAAEDAAKPDDSDPLLDFLDNHASEIAIKADAPGGSELGAVGAAAGAGAATLGGLASAAREKSDDAMSDLDAYLGGNGHTANEARDDAADAVLSGVPVSDEKPGAPIAHHNANDGAEKASGPAWGRLIKFVLALGVLGGLGYGAYTYQDQIKAMFGQVETVSVDENGVPVRTVETTPVVEGDTDTAQSDAPAEPEIVDVNDGADDVVKFTQRLTPEGREVDEGPADGSAGVGEGTAVSGQTPGTQDSADAGAADSSSPEPGAASDATAADAPLLVGQRSIFYEERTGTQAGTAIPGATIWTIVQESPGVDLPLEPAIKAESSIPDIGLTMEMTIRRNGDTTLPASHIIEIIFSVPNTFDGRGIADVQRVTLKPSEQETGNALIGVPAPLDTNIFFIALTDAPTAVETNTQLLRRQGWVDIPMEYISGRRALITIEKGLPGERVFEEAFQFWDANPLPGNG